ncbi:MAG: Spermidine export protein MdtI [Candidatus Erwinia impunctatus]|nr:Spermidine export protein MdtI [Culicoides impunctatus]
MSVEHLLYLILAVALDIIANILLKKSNGFQRWHLGLLSLLAVLAAFTALAQAAKGIDLAVAYALWGAMGIAATAAAGWILFNQKLNYKGGIGVLILLSGIVLLKLS